MNHLRAGIGLLHIVGDGDGVELAHGIVALQDATRVLPSDGRAGFDLRPGDLRIPAAAGAALGHEIVNPAFTFFIARIPILDRRVFDFRIVEGNQFDNGSMQLVLIAHWRGATLEVAYVRSLVCDDQGTFELSGVLRINAEIGRQLHRAAHP